MPYNTDISGNISRSTKQISGNINSSTRQLSGGMKKGVIEDYDVLKNKPSINNVILSGNKTSADLNLQPAGDYATRSELNLHIQDKNYIHKQLNARNVWEITHNLEKYPSVTIVDSAGTIIVGEVHYININSLKVVFTAPFSGTAYLN